MISGNEIDEYIQGTMFEKLSEYCGTVVPNYSSGYCNEGIYHIDRGSPRTAGYIMLQFEDKPSTRKDCDKTNIHGVYIIKRVEW